MSNMVEFILKLKDMMSPGLRELGNKSKSIFDLMDHDILRTQRHYNEFAKPLKLTVDTTGLERAGREFDRFNSKAERSMGFFKTSGAMMVGSMAGNAVMMAGRKAYEMGREGFGVGVEMEKQIVGLSTFVGEQKARSIIDRVVKEGVYTPYKTAQLLPIERGLIPQGLSPERAHRDTWALANAVSATGGSDWALERMGWHMQQAAGQGKIDGRIMREFFMAGIPINRLLQDSMPELKGLSQAKAMDKLDNVTISYDMMSNALYKASQSGGMFAGALDKLSQTIGGKWSTVIDKFQIAGWRMTEGQEKNIKLLEDRMIGFADRLPGIAASMAGDFNTAFQRFDELSPSLGKFGSTLLDVLSPLKDFALSKSVTNLITNFADLSTAILNTPYLKKGIGGLVDIAEGGLNVLAKEANTYRNLWNYVANHDQYNRENDPTIKTSERQGYMWGTAPVGTLEAGMKIDSMAIKHITDSLGGGNFFADIKAVKDWDNYLKKWEPKTLFNTQTLPLPMTWDNKTGVNGKGTKPDTSMDNVGSESSDAIVGGGRKQIIINIRNFAEHFVVNAGNLKDAGNQSKEVFERMFLEVLQSANSAM